VKMWLSCKIELFFLSGIAGPFRYLVCVDSTLHRAVLLFLRVVSVLALGDNATSTIQYHDTVDSSMCFRLQRPRQRLGPRPKIRV